MRVRNIRGGRFGDAVAVGCDDQGHSIDASGNTVAGDPLGCAAAMTAAGSGVAVGCDANGNTVDGNGKIVTQGGCAAYVGGGSGGGSGGAGSTGTAGSSAPWYSQVLTSLQSIGQSGAQIFGAKPAAPGASSSSFLLPLLFVGGAIGIAVYATRKK